MEVGALKLEGRGGMCCAQELCLEVAGLGMVCRRTEISF